jgi:hypothetical protein
MRRRRRRRRRRGLAGGAGARYSEQADVVFCDTGI